LKPINSKDQIILGIVAVVFAAIIGAVAFLFLSPTFERVSPKVNIEKELYWNLQKPIKFEIADASEIKSYNVLFDDGQKPIKLETKVIKSENGLTQIDILPPSFDENNRPKDGNLIIDVHDSSKWNFFDGNQTVTNTKIIIDKRSPIANVITNSYLLRQGGSGIIVAEIADDNIKDYYVSFNDEEVFEMFPFQKKNFYISIITWPVDIKEFKKVNIVAVDMAGNKTVTKVPFYIQPFKEKTDKIKITDDFVNNISKQVLENSNMNVPEGITETFVKVNKEVREKNVKTIREVVKKNLENSGKMTFDVKTFIRMPNAATFAQFGERRHYFYNDQKIDEAWHLGMDWASSKRADIVVTNPGKVIYKGYLGIYGDTAIVDHGWGLGTLYAHTSNIDVEVGDEIKTGQKIGNTGATGAVFGDHLHFGVLVQGIEVNPNEWLDYEWIKVNLTKTINDAIKIINGSTK
jgi:murein DD-endopeptidase MepM/ murein hydrolase activator NlpD